MRRGTSQKIAREGSRIDHLRRNANSVWACWAGRGSGPRALQEPALDGFAAGDPYLLHGGAASGEEVWLVRACVWLRPGLFIAWLVAGQWPNRWILQQVLH